MHAKSPARVHTAASRRISRRGGAWLPIAFLAIAAVALFVGCGSSKPAYCSDRASLEKSVKDVPGLVSSGNLSGLRTQATKIQGEATTLADSANSDFPTETSALKRDVDTLVSSVKDLPPSPSTQDYASVAINAATVVSAVSNFSKAAEAKCG